MYQAQLERFLLKMLKFVFPEYKNYTVDFDEYSLYCENEYNSDNEYNYKTISIPDFIELLSKSYQK